jgi:cholesterol oxidase
MGTDSHDGEIKLRNSWESKSDRNMDDWNVLNVDFDLNNLVPLYEKIRNSMSRIAKEIGENGSSSLTTPLWDPHPSKISSNLTAVVHNLGGCCIGKDRDHGVVNNVGQVYDANDSSPTKTYNSFYVVDGAIIPTSLGVNPSLTISALAFKIAENIAGTSNLPVEKVSIGSEDFYFSR